MSPPEHARPVILPILAGIAVLALFLVWVGPAGVLRWIARFPPERIPLVILAYAGAYITRMGKWSRCLAVPLSRYWKIYAPQAALGTVTPARMGETAVIALLGRTDSTGYGRRVGLFAVVRSVEVALYLVCVVLSALFLGIGTGRVAAAAGLVVATAALLVGILFAGSRGEGVFGTLAKAGRKAAGETMRFEKVAGIAAWTLAHMALEWLSAWWAMSALVACSPLHVVATYFLASFAGIASLIPGGLGVGSATWAFLVSTGCGTVTAAGGAAIVHKGLSLMVIYGGLAVSLAGRGRPGDSGSKRR